MIFYKIKWCVFVVLLVIVPTTFTMFELEEENHFPHELLVAMQKKDFEKVARLCETLSKKILNAPDREGKTILIHAIEKGSVLDVCKVLECGADVNKACNGKTPLMYVVKHKRHELVQLFDSFGARDDDYALFHHAIRSESPELVKELELSRFQINPRQSESLPIIEAVRAANIDMVRACLDSYADKDMKDIEGKTAMNVVQELLENYKQTHRYARKNGFPKTNIEEIEETINQLGDIETLLQDYVHPDVIEKRLQAVRSRVKQVIPEDRRLF